jgi:hypothetical protein
LVSAPVKNTVFFCVFEFLDNASWPYCMVFVKRHTFPIPYLLHTFAPTLIIMTTLQLVTIFLKGEYLKPFHCHYLRCTKEDFLFHCVGCFRNVLEDWLLGTEVRPKTRHKRNKRHKIFPAHVALAFIRHPSPRTDAFFGHVWLFLSCDFAKKKHCAMVECLIIPDHNELISRWCFFMV